MSVATIPGGPSKGTPITEVDEKSISYWRTRIGNDLASNPNKRFAEKDRAWLSAADAELARRRGGGAPATPAAPAPAALVHQGHLAPVQAVVGSYNDGHKADQVLASLAATAHLVSPAPTCGKLPEGCSLVLSQVIVDADNETYKIPGGSKQGLAKVALDKIFGACGGSWIARQCGRVDNGSDPHYCHYKAVGTVRDFDGSFRVLTGEVEIDMRDGGAEVESIRAREAKKAREPNYRGDGGTSEIAQVRKFILRHAASKAMNRAIRSLGVRPAYTADELCKPFVVARVQFTGQTNDPALKQMFAEKTAEAFLGGRSAMYGDAPARALPVASYGHAPPPIGSVPVEDESAVEPSYFADAPQQSAALPAPTQQAPATHEQRAAAIDRGDGPHR